MKYAVFAVCWLLPLSVLADAPPEQAAGPFEPGIDLPAGQGRDLVATACTRCHDLKGLSAYKGYWNRARWRAMVETMVENGARLNPDQKERVTDYLTEHYGPESQ